MIFNLFHKMVMPWEKRQLPWSEQLKFKLRQKRGQQVVMVVRVLCVSAILILAGLYIWERMGERKGGVTIESKIGVGSKPAPTQEVVSLNKHRIAILPFVNLSTDAENEYFSDGMTEEMISRLSKISGLEVIARTSVMTYKGKGKKVADIGQELRAGTVLEGSVRKAVDRLRITVQLINAQNEAHLWSQDYDRELKDVFAIQGDIAQRVAEALEVQLLAKEKQRIKKKETESLEAYNLYLKSRYFHYQWTPDTIQKAIEYAEQAIERDPAYARAYTALAYAHWNLEFYNFPPREVMPKAKAAAEKALELDDALAEAYDALAWIKLVYDWDWLGAESAVKRALSLDPSYEKVMLYMPTICQ